MYALFDIRRCTGTIVWVCCYRGGGGGAGHSKFIGKKASLGWQCFLFVFFFFYFGERAEERRKATRQSSVFCTAVVASSVLLFAFMAAPAASYHTNILPRYTGILFEILYIYNGTSGMIY